MADTTPLLPPQITQIQQMVLRTQKGELYSQDIAFMSDGSKWEIPCVGNGNMWRKINKSIPELQAEFDLYFVELSEAGRKSNGSLKSKSKNNVPRRD